MTPSNNTFKPFMAYLDRTQYALLKRFSDRSRIPMSKLIREAIDMRIAKDNQYVSGFNAGIDAAIKMVSENKAATMRFPSGKSFAELINEDLETARMSHADRAENHEEIKSA
jgi:Ribbon-helix-helix domain